MIAAVQGREVVIVLVIVLLLCGGSQLPKLVRSLGDARKDTRDRSNESKDGEAPR